MQPKFICGQDTHGPRAQWSPSVGCHPWATVVSRIAYASPVWWGVLDESSRQRLQALLTKIIKQSLLSSSHPTIKELCDAADSRLFSEVLGNPHHVLHHLLPPVRHNIAYITCDSALTTELFPSLKAILLKRLSLTT